MTTEKDRFEPARAVADAVLYEGYVLYPYRASARKNQTRWQFGVLVPPGYAAVDGSERTAARTQCPLRPAPGASLAVRMRCLQVQRRSVEEAGEEGRWMPVEVLSFGGKAWLPWDEAVEQVVDVEAPTRELAVRTIEHDFVLGAGEEVEPIAEAGRIVRRRDEVRGRLSVSAAPVPDDDGLVVVSVDVENTTAWTPGPEARRDDAVGRSLVAAHVILAVDDGQFISLLDPPPGPPAGAAAACANSGAFPILIDDDRVVLSSPIILYDHPAIAPESPGDLYDATEIDEILALRVLTLTEAEKAEARATDPRAAAVVDRCEVMPPDAWERLHGVIRSPGPAPWWDPGADAAFDPERSTLQVAGVELRKGSAVRLKPTHRADAQDLFLVGRQATVAGIFRDVDGGDQVAVTVDDDPATVELAWQGRYLFFHPDEVEPLEQRP